jgi:hypothetical protein
VNREKFLTARRNTCQWCPRERGSILGLNKQRQGIAHPNEAFYHAGYEASEIQEKPHK